MQGAMGAAVNPEAIKASFDEQELEAVERKLELYKPLASSLDNLRTAVRKIKEAEKVTLPGGA